MKFRDIPQFTRFGSWECDFDISGFTREIKRMVSEEGLQLNPDFQRGNVWNDLQQVKFVEFLLKGGRTARVVYLNNPSWKRPVKNGGYNDFVCVDGLQRTTAVMRFVDNEIKVFDTYFNDYEDSPRITTQTMKIHVNDLPTKKEVLQWYIDFNSGGTIHTEDEIQKVKKLLKECE